MLRVILLALFSVLVFRIVTTGSANVLFGFSEPDAPDASTKAVLSWDNRHDGALVRLAGNALAAEDYELAAQYAKEALRNNLSNGRPMGMLLEIFDKFSQADKADQAAS